MNNIERDEQRIKEFYRARYGGESSLCENFNRDWGYNGFYCMIDIPDISEDFHRMYCSKYGELLWLYVFLHQTKLSDQFYSDYYYKMRCTSIYPHGGVIEILSTLIKFKRVSEDWIRRNSYIFPPEVWEKCYTQ